jgi:hypothetical protein
MIGGIDRSGKNKTYNFSPGTAYARIGFFSNYTNRNGGYGGFPDTGDQHKVWFSGISIHPDIMAKKVINPDGSVTLSRPVEDADGHMIMTEFTGVTQNLEV